MTDDLEGRLKAIEAEITDLRKRRAASISKAAADRLPDRFDYVEARLKRIEQHLGLGPLELSQFFAEWNGKKPEEK